MREGTESILLFFNFSAFKLQCSYCTVVVYFPLQRTPLHVAAREGYKYTVKSLVEKGANINLKNKDGVSVTRLLVASRLIFLI